MANSSRVFNVISLYTGAGGLDYGFEAAGFETLAALDIDQDCCETIKVNRTWPIIHDDIAKVPSKTILRTAGLRRGEVDVVIGGPPCQPFSKSAYWVLGDSGRLRDPRANTLVEFMRCVEDMLPRAFLLENVHGISYSGKEEGLALLETLTRRINRKHKVNYRLSWKVINAADFGVPQIRMRFFLVGSRNGKTFQFPAPTHGPLNTPSRLQELLSLDPTQEHRTAWDALGDFKPPADEDLNVKGYWADLLPSIPEGENYLWHTDRKGGLSLFGWRTRFWSFLLKLAKDRPSWTLQAQPGPAIGPFHWDNRLLSIEEMARLQTFPDGLNYVGNRLSVQRQLGNAVPSLLAEILAREIAYQVLGAHLGGPLKFAVRQKRPVPPANPLEPVPSRYLAHLGDHPEHPGEGKGPRAERRTTTFATRAQESSIQ
jgi:DNA (cytosine-5)-methyltransferase 1